MTSLPSAETNNPGTSKVDQEGLEEQPQISRHNEYYMDDELSVFLVRTDDMTSILPLTSFDHFRNSGRNQPFQGPPLLLGSRV